MKNRESILENYNDSNTLPLRLRILDILYQAIENNLKTEELVENILNAMNNRNAEELKEEYQRVVENILDEVTGDADD